MIVRERRKELGLTQRELGSSLVPPVKQSAVSQWEAGTLEIPEDRYADIARVLKMDLAELSGHTLYVKGEGDQNHWRSMVLDEPGYSTRLKLLLIALPLFLTEEEGHTVFVSCAQIARRVKSLTEEDVEGLWDDMLASPYVERWSEAEWVLKLKFPSRGD